MAITPQVKKKRKEKIQMTFRHIRSENILNRLTKSKKKKNDNRISFRNNKIYKKTR